MPNWQRDKQYKVCTVERVSVHDEGEESYTLSFGDGTSIMGRGWPPPETGQKMRLYGRGLGYPVRGMAVEEDDGSLRLLSYMTEAEMKADREQQAATRKRKREKEWIEGLDAYRKRVKVLPKPFRGRLNFFLSQEGWGPEFGGYELFTCEEAVKVALHVSPTDKPQEAIRAFYDLPWSEQKDVLGEGHSGNTVGKACRLAVLYLLEPELVWKDHATACAFAGCQEAGCYSGLSEMEILVQATQGRT